MSVRDLETDQTVVREERIEQTSYRTPRLLNRHYRIWIQAIGSAGLRGQWSLPLNLTVQADV